MPACDRCAPAGRRLAGDGPDRGRRRAAAAGESLITVIDNSHADSILEVDRAANFQSGSGTAGSDHDGSAVDMLATLVHTVRPGEEGT